MFVYARIEEGGLGILDLTILNQALLTKWWWKFHTEPQLLWNKIIHTLFYQRRRPLKEGRTFRPYSFWWKGVLCQRDIIRWGVSYKLGDGNNIDLWLDRLCGDSTLHRSFPEIYGLSTHKYLRISDCLTREGWDWTMFPSDDNRNGHGLGPTLTEFRDRISVFKLEHGLDRVLWR